MRPAEKASKPVTRTAAGGGDCLLGTAPARQAPPSLTRLLGVASILKACMQVLSEGNWSGEGNWSDDRATARSCAPAGSGVAKRRASARRWALPVQSSMACFAVSGGVAEGGCYQQLLPHDFRTQTAAWGACIAKGPSGCPQTECRTASAVARAAARIAPQLVFVEIVDQDGVDFAAEAAQVAKHPRVIKLDRFEEVGKAPR